MEIGLMEDLGISGRIIVCRLYETVGKVVFWSLRDETIIEIIHFKGGELSETKCCIVQLMEEWMVVNCMVKAITDDLEMYILFFHAVWSWCVINDTRLESGLISFPVELLHGILNTEMNRSVKN